MKKTKVIIPALGLLLLSTAASVTGTVAWFAANATVYANGMSITAKTDSEFLVISKEQTLGALTSVNLAAPTGDAAKVLPTNWRDNSGYKWVSASGTSTTVGTASGGYQALDISETNNLGVAAGKNYFVVDTVYVGLASGSSTTGKDLKCNVNFVTSQSSNLNKCLTVGLDAAPDRGTATDFDERYVLGVASSAAETGTTISGTSVLLAGENLSTTGTAIKVYAFFNGDDENCTTANAINLAGITINLTFNLVDHQG